MSKCGSIWWDYAEVAATIELADILSTIPNVKRAAFDELLIITVQLRCDDGEYNKYRLKYISR